MSAEGGSSSSLGAIIGVIVAVTLFAVGIGYLLFQRGLKKKQEKAREVKVTHLATRHVGEEDFHLDEVDEKISKNAKEKSKSKGMINGKMKKKIDKKSSAGDTGTGDTKSGPQNSENDKEALLEVNKEDINDSEFDKIAESVAVATRTRKRRQANRTNKLKSSLLTRKRRNNPKASLTNAAPKIISMEFDESSYDESSSSSEEEEEEEEDSSSSSDSDSSSSSEGSESSSQIKARKRRERRIAADKKKSTNTKGKKPSKPRRSNTNTKQRQRPSRLSRSNNIV